jgi:hypothetical protein
MSSGRRDPSMAVKSIRQEKRGGEGGCGWLSLMVKGESEDVTGA